MDELLKEAAALAGRDVEVEVAADGKFVVLWMNFDSSPPPKADSPEEALKAFISYLKNKPKEEHI